jgi:hypothetical protein
VVTLPDYPTFLFGSLPLFGFSAVSLVQGFDFNGYMGQGSHGVKTLIALCPFA